MITRKKGKKGGEKTGNNIYYRRQVNIDEEG